ncbi:myosin binding subunit isoform X2 [Oratosquilla oratoria]|uniref:myosin binding subunit isoform X2 n=1 Tax=Oratosquilla oratoria TaxID=337810 RepID=UPI003F75B5A2
MAADNRSCSALFKRAEQLRRWEESETNRTPTSEKPRKVNFSDGCIFLAACSAGDKQEVLRLLENGADIDTANVDGLTALHAACIDDNLDMVEFLVDQGAGVNQGDMEGWTPLHATASCGFNSIAKFLIDRGADLSLVNNDGDLAIDIADSDEMENLLQEEIDHREIDCDMAREQEERKMMEDAKIWLASGKVEDVPHYKTGANALHVAAAKGYIEVMRMLLQAGANINSQDFDGWTPLHAAAHWGQRQAVDVLCEHSADMSIRNCVGQTCIDVADQNLLGLLKNLKAQYDAKKTVKRRKLSPPHRDHSKKPERNTDEKKNKVNKENASISPIILPSTPAIKRTVPNQTRVDESEAQSWRRVVPARTKPPLEDKNQKEEVSRTISSPVKIDNKETEDSQDVTLRRAQSLGKGESVLLVKRERLKAQSCPALTQWQDGVGNGGGGGLGDKIGGGHEDTQSFTSSMSSISQSQKNPSPLSSSRLSSSTTNLPTTSNLCSYISTVPSLTTVTTTSHTLSSSNHPTIFTHHPPLTTSLSTSSIPASMPLTVTSSTVSSSSSSSSSSTSNKGLQSSSTGSLAPTVGTNTTTNKDPRLLARSASLKERIQRNHVDSMVRVPVMSEPVTSTAHNANTSPPARTVGSNVTTLTSNGGLTTLPPPPPPPPPPKTAPTLNLSTDPSVQQLPNPALSPTSALPTSTSSPSPSPSPSTSAVGQPLTPSKMMSPGSVIKNFFKSFVPPSRDEESETQRKAHAKMVRSTRRSTQGVTLEDLKSAEQFIKNKQTPTTSSPETRDNLTTTTATTTTPTLSSSSISSPSINSISTTTPLHCTTTTSTTTTTTIASRPKPESPTKTDEEDRRPSWRMKLDESDKSKFSLEDVRAKEKQTAQPDTTEEDAQSVTAPLRKKNTNEKADENERNSQQTREGTQAAIQRRKRPKRRSTGVVHVDMDEIDPDKKSQRHQVDDDGGEDEEDDDSVSELAGNRDKDQNDDDTEEEEEEDEDEEDEEEEEEDDDVKVVIVKVNTIKNETERINRRNKVLQEKNERRRKIEELKKEIEKKALEKKAAGDKDRNNNRRSNEYKARVKSKLNEKLEEVERWYAMKKAAEEAARKKKEEEEEKEKEEEEETQVKGEGKEKEEVEEERTIEEEEEKRSKIASKEAARKEVEKWYLKKKEAEKAQEAREEKKEVESRTKKEGEEKNTKVIEKREEKRHKREEEKKEQEKLEEEKRRKKEQERLEEEKRLEEQEAVWKKKKKDDVKKMATEEAEKEFEKRRKKKVKKELDKKMKAEEKNKDPEELEAAKRKKDEASGRTSEIEGSASVGQQKPPETPGTPTLDVEALLAQYYEEEVEKIRKENAEKERKRREKWEAIRRRDEEEEEAERAKRELEASLAQNSAAVGEPSPAAGGGGGVGVFWMDEEHGQAPGSGTQKGFEDQSVSDRCDVTKGSSTTSLGTSVNSRPSSRASSIGPENGDIDYKKLYEEQLGENKRLLERLRISDTDLQEARTTLDNNNKKNNTRLALAEADKREKRALERKLSEMEEELKQLQKLKAENEKLKAENRALTRVVSKLTNSATTNLGNLASAANAAK